MVWQTCRSYPSELRFSKHVHLDLGLESIGKREAGFGVGEGGNSGRKVQETVDVRVEVAGLLVGDQAL